MQMIYSAILWGDCLYLELPRTLKEYCHNYFKARIVALPEYDLAFFRKFISEIQTCYFRKGFYICVLIHINSKVSKLWRTLENMFNQHFLYNFKSE